MQSFWPLIEGYFSKHGRFVIERHWTRRELEFDSQNELPDAGVFLAGRMNRTQIFWLSIRIKSISMPRYDIIKQLGLSTRRASHSFLSHHWVGLEVQLHAYPIFQQRRLGETKSEGFRPLFLSHQGLEGPIWTQDKSTWSQSWAQKKSAWRIEIFISTDTHLEILRR